MKRLMVAVMMVAASPLLAGYAQPDSANDAHGAAPKTSVRTTPSGMVVQSVQQGDVVVTTYGRSAPAVVINNPVDSPGDTQGEAEFSISVDDKAASDALAAKTVGPTVYEMTLASGNFTPEEACEFAQGLGEYGCVTSAQVMRERRAEARRQAAPAALAPVYDSRCYEFKTTEGDGTKWSHNCNVRRIDTTNSNYVWIANQMKATGGEDDTGTFADGISGVGMRADYQHSSAQAVDWQPAESRPYSACQDRTVTVQGRSGVSYSSSSTVCEDLLAPWNSPAFQYFGSKWTGPEAPRDHTRATIAASLHRVPNPGTRAYEITAWLRWN